MEKLLQDCPEGDHKNHTEHIAVKRWIPVYKRHDWSDSDLLEIYKRILSDVATFERSHSPKTTSNTENYAKQISIHFLNLCTKPEIWKQIQFAHINFFPNMTWLVSFILKRCELTIYLLV